MTDTITIDAAALSAVLDAALCSCSELDNMTDADSLADVWYHAEQIKRQIFTAKQMVDAAERVRG